jgi:2,3-bisphosphoglycerate-independent phosphoglycerate mutase
MADYPVAALAGRTPLQAARKPVLDGLAQRGTVGLVQTVPEGMAPGSDTANLAVFGYDPRVYYNGRSPFEAASMGIELSEGDVAFRCNLVTLSAGEPFAEKVMLDHSAGQITSAEAWELMSLVNETLGRPDICFYPGISYRHLMVWQEAPRNWHLTPPHDILGQKIGPYLPGGRQGAVLQEMMEKSAGFLPGHQVNGRRKSAGLGAANAIWLWGHGQRSQLPGFAAKYGLKGAVISEVDLIKGLGRCAGLELLEVPGLTGDNNTNFAGMANAALAALLEGLDFIFLHLEAPDEYGHRQETENKVRAIELIDEQVLRVLTEALDARKEMYRMMVLPDHATPLSLRTHTSDPVPFVIFQSGREQNSGVAGFDELSALETKLFIREGYRLMDLFLGTCALREMKE